MECEYPWEKQNWDKPLKYMMKRMDKNMYMMHSSFKCESTKKDNYQDIFKFYNAFELDEFVKL